MRLAVLLATAVLAVPSLSAQRLVPTGGEWLIGPTDHAGKIELEIRYGEGGRHSSNWGRTIPVSGVVGLWAADMRGSGSAVHFKIVRAGGTLNCEGGEGTSVTSHSTLQ